MTEPPATEHGEVRLADGRALAYLELGDPSGRPLFYFHGFPGSRLESRAIATVVRRLGVRILAVDRPGYGYSDFLPGRRLVDWPDDVAALADALGIDRFGVVGASGGGPYAAVCAHRLAARLDVAGIVSGLAPPDDPRIRRGMIAVNRLGLACAGRAPWLPRLVFAALAPLFRRRPQLIVARLATHIAEPDRRCLRRAELRQVFADTFREAFRRGSRGAAHDAVVYGRPWGFRLRDVTMRVHLWHGERDVVVPVAMGRYLARELPNCRATFYPGEGHFSLALNRAAEMFGTP